MSLVVWAPRTDPYLLVNEERARALLGLNQVEWRALAAVVGLRARSSRERGSGAQFYRLDELTSVLPSQFCNMVPVLAPKGAVSIVRSD
jgi:hypothetical protein